jgi:hypothetical protein
MPIDKKRLESSVFKTGTYSLFAYLLVSIVVLVVASVIVKDTRFIREHPWKFTMETLFMSVIATFPFMYLIWSRSGHFRRFDVVEYLILILKFGGLHVLLQTSGFYSVLFRDRHASV